MARLPTLRRVLPALLFVGLVVCFIPSSLGSADDPDAGPTVEELAAQVAELESLVKSLTLQVTKVSDSVLSDLEELRPRVTTTENIAKEDAYEVARLSGTVAELSRTAQALGELPGRVASLRSAVASLTAALEQRTDTLVARVRANEATLAKLHPAVERNAQLAEAVRERVNGLSGQLEQASRRLDALTLRFEERNATLSTRLIDVEARLGPLMEAMDELTGLSQLLADLASRVQQLEVAGNRTATQAARLGDRIGEAQEVMKRLSVAVQANATALKEGIARLGELKARFREPTAELRERVERLTGKIAQVLAEAERSREEVAELKRQVAKLRREVLSQLPSREELRREAEASAAEQVREAKVRASQAQGLAVAALLAGLAATLLLLLR